MNRWEWEGMGLEKTFPLISTWNPIEQFLRAKLSLNPRDTTNYRSLSNLSFVSELAKRWWPDRWYIIWQQTTSYNFSQHYTLYSCQWTTETARWSGSYMLGSSLPTCWDGVSDGNHPESLWRSFYRAAWNAVAV